MVVGRPTSLDMRLPRAVEPLVTSISLSQTCDVVDEWWTNGGAVVKLGSVRRARVAVVLAPLALVCLGSGLARGRATTRVVRVALMAVAGVNLAAALRVLVARREFTTPITHYSCDLNRYPWAAPGAGKALVQDVHAMVDRRALRIGGRAPDEAMAARYVRWGRRRDAPGSQRTVYG